MAIPGLVITDDDLGPAVNLACWISLVMMCISVLVKVSSKLFQAGQSFSLRRLQADDFLVLMAMFFAICQSVSVSNQVPNGAGRHIRTLSDSDIHRFEKAGYASQILYVSAISMAKLATLCFILTLTRTPLHRNITWAVVLLTLLWTIVSLFALSFQCPVPDSWAILANTCVNQVVLWEAIESLNIATEFLLAVIPPWFLWGLQMAWRKKSVIMLAFAVRALDIPLFSLRIFYLVRGLHSTDRTYEEFAAIITTQVVINVSIMLACLPFMKRLVDELQPGWSTSNARMAFGYKGSYTTSRAGSSMKPLGYTYNASRSGASNSRGRMRSESELPLDTMPEAGSFSVQVRRSVEVASGR